jgi:hypothetical protein
VLETELGCGDGAKAGFGSAQQARSNEIIVKTKILSELRQRISQRHMDE